MQLTRRPPDLVIFDCDGVLVDSERIAVEVDLIIFERVGLTITRQEVVDRFVGGASSVEAAVEAHLGHPLAAEMKAEFQQLYERAIERDLKPVPGVVEVLSQLDRQTCVASNSTLESLCHKLTRVGLYGHFDGRIFSAVDVGRLKPAPDVYLYAAASMRTDPDRCVVVEDSLFGVMAARAAGMHVLAFASDLVAPDSLEGPSTTIFTEMSELLGLIEELPLKSGVTPGGSSGN